MYKADLTKAYMGAVLFSILVGFSFLGIKMCVPYADSLHILVWRFNFALISLLILMALKIVKVDLRGKPKKDLYLTAGFPSAPLWVCLEIPSLAKKIHTIGVDLFLAE